MAQDEPAARKCRLFLSFVNVETGEAVASKVRLSRLAPPGEDWLQANREVPKGGAYFDALPAGKYRVLALAARSSSDDQASFTVDGDTTDVRIALSMPRPSVSTLVVVNERGRPLTQATMGRGYHKTRMRHVFIPWERGCNAVGERRIVNIRCLTSGLGSRQPEGDVLSARNGTFVLDPWREDSHQLEVTRHRTLHFSARTDVWLRQRFAEPGDHAYLALSIDRRRILDSVVLPDGSNAFAEGAKIRTRCRAVPTWPGDQADLWRTLKIEVRVVLKGYERLRFEIGAGESLPRREMVVARPASNDD